MVNSSFNKILQASQMVTLSLYGKNGEKLEAKLKSPVALGCFMRKLNRLISPDFRDGLSSVPLSQLVSK